MTIFAVIGDVHKNYDDLHRVCMDIRLKTNVDAVLLTGDLTDLPRGVGASGAELAMAAQDVAATVVHVQDTVGRPVYWVQGNHDGLAFRALLPRDVEGALLHGRVVEVNGVRVAGLGGSSVKFGWQGEWRMANPFPPGTQADVLLAHAPPPGRFGLCRNGYDAGEPAVREVATALGARAIACGHIHEAKGVGFASEGGPVVLNAGALGRPYPWLGWGYLRVGAREVDASLTEVG